MARFDIAFLDVRDIVNDVTIDMTIKITGMKLFKIKLFFAKILMRMAAIILGCNINIAEEGNK